MNSLKLNSTGKGGATSDARLGTTEVDELLKKLQQVFTRNAETYTENMLEYEHNLGTAFQQLRSETKYVLELKGNDWIEGNSALRKRLEALQNCFRELSTITAERFRAISDEVVDACYLEETMSARSHASGNHVKSLEANLLLAEQAERTQRESYWEAEEEYFHVKTISDQLERKVKRWSWWERRIPYVPQRRRMLEISQRAEMAREKTFQAARVKHDVAVEEIYLGRYALASEKSGEELLKDIVESAKATENTLLKAKQNLGDIYRHASMFEVFIASDLMLLSRTFFLRCVLQLLWSENMAQVFSISPPAKSANDDILAMCQVYLSDEEWEEVFCPLDNFIEDI